MLIYNYLGVDKASMLTHTYTHKHPKKIKVVICIHQADCPFLLVVWCLNWWFGNTENEYGHIRHRMFLLRSCVIKQHQITSSYVGLHYVMYSVCDVVFPQVSAFSDSIPLVELKRFYHHDWAWFRQCLFVCLSVTTITKNLLNYCSDIFSI